MKTKASIGGARLRLAIIVSHPIQYYVPLYRRLAARSDLDIKVFFTWHAATKAQHDPGFDRSVAWDIPLTDGYDYELVENVAPSPGSRHFWGIRTPALVESVMRWEPDAVHITGYAYASHLSAMRAFHRAGVPVLFRGDSHLLDEQPSWRWWIKRPILRRVYRYATACLYVGKNNHDYYRRIGVPEHKLYYCPHCVEVERFAEPEAELEEKATAWRRELAIDENAKVVLYAGKFEQRKRPIELIEAILKVDDPSLIVVLAGNGPLDSDVEAIAARGKGRVRLLPFQNQQMMPVVYRLGDVVAMPSASGETWGLALNEAIGSGRRIIASDRVGGATDIISSSEVGATFQSGDWSDFRTKVLALLASPRSMSALKEAAMRFDISATESALLEALQLVIREKAIPRKAGHSRDYVH